MNIFVLVKQVPDPEATVRPGPAGLDIEDRWVTGFFDEVALERAVQLRDAVGGTVTVVSAGGKRAVDALRRGIAFGANRAVHLSHEGLDGAGGLAVARALAAFLAGEAPDLVLAGRQSADAEQGLVGPAVAELLGLPCITGVVELSLSEGRLTARRPVEGGEETLAAPLPAVVTAHKGLAEPRVPKVMHVMKAMRASVEVVTPADPTPGLELVGYDAPPRRPPVQMLEEAPALVAALRDAGVLA